MLKYFIFGISGEEWRKNMLAYWAEFEKIKHRLPKNGVAAFEHRDLHDSEIKQISFKGCIKKIITKNLLVEIENESYAGTFVHEDVKEFSFKYVSDNKKYSYLCQYLYGEILLDSGLWNHSFICSDSMEVSIRCGKIKWVSKTHK